MRFRPATQFIRRFSTSYCFESESRSIQNSKMLTRRITLAKHFEGAPKLTDFKIVEEITLPNLLQDGEILCKAEYLTVDPYMRGFTNMMKIGDTMPGGQVARVVESKNADYPEGTQVVGNFGWRNLTVYKPVTGDKSSDRMYKLPDMKNLPDSYALGAMGMPGNTAYFGLTEICKPKAGDTVVVSAAGGAVGSLVGQIAKIKGCKVLGFAGEEHKIKWIKETLGFDEAFNYKTVNVFKTLRQYAPEGVDCYFDNVGGQFSFNVMGNMKEFGRIGLCGAISVYNSDARNPPMVPVDYKSLIYKQIRIQGFVVYRWADRWFEGINQIRDWILEDKIKVEETVVHGFENMPQAFIQLLEGKNTGKMIIKA